MATSAQGRFPIPSGLLDSATLYTTINFGSANGDAGEAVFATDFFFGYTAPGGTGSPYYAYNQMMAG